MKYLIDKEKLEARIAELLAGDGRRQADNVEGIALCALRECLVPYEEKKEGCTCCSGRSCPAPIMDFCHIAPCQFEEIQKREYMKKKDNRCTNCGGLGELEDCKDSNIFLPCALCNGTGKEPRKEQDTRTHAWETPVSKQTYYSQDEVRKMLEDLKTRDNLAGNSKEVQEDRRHMNAKIDKKIAEL